MKDRNRTLLIFVSFISFFLTFSHVAWADTYNTEDVYLAKYGSQRAFDLAKTIPDNEISIQKIENPKEARLESVGRVVNVESDYAGSGVFIGKHTFLTNNHIVRDKQTNEGDDIYRVAPLNELHFYPANNPKGRPYTFSVKDVHMIKGVDLAIVHTNEELPNSIKPMTMATEKSIKSLNFKDKISIIGYPKTRKFAPKYPEMAKLPYPQMFRSNGFFLNYSSTSEPHFYMNVITRGGNSGSPIINSNDELIGIFPNGFNNSGKATYKFSEEEMAYGIALVDNVLKEIKANMY